MISRTGRDIMRRMRDDKTTRYSIADVAALVGTSPRMIREYERQGLIRPLRVNGRRVFDTVDAQFIAAIRHYLDDVGMSINGLRVLFQMAPCWEIKQCSHRGCPAWRNPAAKCYDTIRTRDGACCRPEMCARCPIRLVSTGAKLTRLRVTLVKFPKVQDPK